MPTRVALYVSVISCRNVGPAVSSVTITCVGVSSPNMCRNVFANPNGAPISSPVDRSLSGSFTIFMA